MSAPVVDSIEIRRENVPGRFVSDIDIDLSIHFHDAEGDISEFTLESGSQAKLGKNV